LNAGLVVKNRFVDVVIELRPSPDFRIKGASPWVGICIHHTGIGNQDPSLIDWQKWKSLLLGAVSWLSTKDMNYLSAHFVIGRDGECIQLVDPDSNIAFHAGVSSYVHPLEGKVLPNWNQYAIGIELIGDGNKIEYTDDQYNTLAKLCALCMERYKEIDPRCIVGHSDVSPGRKVDPGRHFNWRKFFVLLHLHIAELEASR
jgi:N-acetyl-anhydromuramyl-L-alanine amidase AmpD